MPESSAPDGNGLLPVRTRQLDGHGVVHINRPLRRLHVVMAALAAARRFVLKGRPPVEGALHGQRNLRAHSRCMSAIDRSGSRRASGCPTLILPGRERRSDSSPGRFPDALHGDSAFTAVRGRLAGRDSPCAPPRKKAVRLFEPRWTTARCHTTPHSAPQKEASAIARDGLKRLVERTVSPLLSAQGQTHAIDSARIPWGSRLPGQVCDQRRA